MLALQKTLDSSWEIARVSLRQDLDTIQTVLNRRWGQTFGAANLLPASSISGAAALSRISDTNIILTLGGSPTTALLKATSITASWSGVLAYARGGTNIGTAWTQGSIFFAGATTFLQDNTHLFWDASNNRLGVGINTPSTTLHVSGAASVTLAANTRWMRGLVADNGAVANHVFAVGHTANAGDGSRDDHDYSIGYNCGPAGTRENAAEESFAWVIEDYYKPGAGAAVLETYFQMVDTSNNVYRPWSIQVQRGVTGWTTTSSINLQAHDVSYLDAAGTQYVKFQGASQFLANSCAIQATVNNYAPFQQINAALGGFIKLPYINASDRIQLGDGTPDVQFGKALVALGGGAAPTLGTIGGSGPTAAAQNTWMRWVDSAGNVFWVPVWK